MLDRMLDIVTTWWQMKNSLTSRPFGLNMCLLHYTTCWMFIFGVPYVSTEFQSSECFVDNRLLQQICERSKHLKMPVLCVRCYCFPVLQRACYLTLHGGLCQRDCTLSFEASDGAQNATFVIYKGRPHLMCSTLWRVTFYYFSWVAGIFPEFLKCPRTTKLVKSCQQPTLFLRESADTLHLW